MRNSIVVSAVVYVCLMLSGSPILAQESASPVENRIPYVRVGILYGRTGIASGPSSYVEINPIRWLGFCGLISRSLTTHQIDDGTARASGLSMGGCVTAHLPEIKKFRISPFAQVARENDHNRFTMLLGDGTIYRDGDDRLRRIWTGGVTVDRPIFRKGPRWVVRFGRNFGNGPAVTSARGLYFVGGIIFPIDHPARLGHSLRSMLEGKSSVGHPSGNQTTTASAN